MFKRKIDLYEERPTKKNYGHYADTTIKLYNNGEYEDALYGFEALCEFNSEMFKSDFTPLIAICERASNVQFTAEDKKHFRNKAILRSFGWVLNVYWIVGIIGFVSVSYVLGNIEDSASSLSLKSTVPFLGGGFFLLYLAGTIWFRTKKFTASKGITRCKYCGHFTGFVAVDQCLVCNKYNPAPNALFDSRGEVEIEEQDLPNTISEFDDKYQEELPNQEFEKEFYSWLKNKKDTNS